MTVQQLIYLACRNSGIVLFAGRTPSSYELEDARLSCNLMLDGWNNERLNAYQIVRRVFNLVASKPSYTLGPDGDLVAQRPVRIEAAGVIDSEGRETPLEMPDWAAYSKVRDKALTAEEPYALYDDRLFPLTTIYLYPVPTGSSQQIALYVWSQLTAFDALTDNANLPPGYAEAIVYNLAIRLNAFWTSGEKRPISPQVMELAREGKAMLKRINLPRPVMRCDEALLSGCGNFDILRGDYFR